MDHLYGCVNGALTASLRTKIWMQVSNEGCAYQKGLLWEDVAVGGDSRIEFVKCWRKTEGFTCDEQLKGYRNSPGRMEYL